MDRRRGLMGVKKGSRVPEGYEEVKYLESNGNAGAAVNSISGISWVSGNEYRAKMAYGSYDKVATGRTYSGSSTVYLEISPTQVTVYNNSDPATFNGTFDSGEHLLESKENGQVILDGSLLGTVSVGSIGSSSWMGLLCYDLNGWYIYTAYTGKMYSFAISVSGEDKFSVIPCIRKADSKPFFYDEISGNFYGNDGTGEFGYEKLDGTYVAPL